MRPDDSDHARLWDIVRWGERLAQLVRGVTWQEYQCNVEKQTAVERCIEVIGEAARHLSDDFKERHHDIPWREIVQQRNIIAHGYFDLEHDRLWRVAAVEVPRLVEQLTPLVDNPPPDPEPESDQSAP
jgi:uncharacterized protein with HEPN domain